MDFEQTVREGCHTIAHSSLARRTHDSPGVHLFSDWARQVTDATCEGGRHLFVLAQKEP